MKIEVDEERVIVLKNVYSGVILETEEGNKLGLCMRDDTFEGTITRASDKAKKNIRVDMESLSIEDVDESLIRDAMRYRLLRDEDNWGADDSEWEALGELSHAEFDELIDSKLSQTIPDQMHSEIPGFEGTLQELNKLAVTHTYMDYNHAMLSGQRAFILGKRRDENPCSGSNANAESLWDIGWVKQSKECGK